MKMQKLDRAGGGGGLSWLSGSATVSFEVSLTNIKLKSSLQCVVENSIVSCQVAIRGNVNFPFFQN